MIVGESVDAAHANAMKLRRDAGIPLGANVDESADAAHMNAGERSGTVVEGRVAHDMVCVHRMA